MTRAQWVVPAILEREPGITQSRLAALTDVEPITIGRLLDRLEANGLIEPMWRFPICRVRFRPPPTRLLGS